MEVTSYKIKDIVNSIVNSDGSVNVVEIDKHPDDEIFFNNKWVFPSGNELSLKPLEEYFEISKDLSSNGDIILLGIANIIRTSSKGLNLTLNEHFEIDLVTQSYLVEKSNGYVLPDESVLENTEDGRDKTDHIVEAYSEYFYSQDDRDNVIYLWMIVDNDGVIDTIIMVHGVGEENDITLVKTRINLKEI